MKYNFLLIVISTSFLHSYTENSALYYGNFSDNFVIRWGFQNICQHHYDLRPWHPTEEEGVTVEPSAVGKGDLVFVRDINKFMETVHPLINNPYIIVTSGEFRDGAFPQYEDYLNDTKIIAWFCVHPCCNWFPKNFYPIPLGIIQNRAYYHNRESMNQFFYKLRQTRKKHLLYMNFEKNRTIAMRTYEDREDVYNLFKNKSFCRKGQQQSFKNFLKEMAQCKFVLSPDGLGPDCYRTWEALLVGSIPVVKSSAKDGLFKDLPVLIVNNWHDVTESLLTKTWNEFTKKRFNIETLYMEYWVKKIHNVQAEFLSNQTTDFDKQAK